MRLAVSFVALALMSSPATSTLLYKNTESMYEISKDQRYEALEGFGLTPGKYRVSINFDRETDLTSDSIVSGIFIYDIDCGGFICGGSDGPLAWIYSRVSSTMYVANIELKAARREGTLIHLDDRGIYSLFATTSAANYIFAIVAVPEPASWAMMIAGFGLLGAAARRRRRTVTFA